MECLPFLYFFGNALLMVVVCAVVLAIVIAAFVGIFELLKKMFGGTVSFVCVMLLYVCMIASIIAVSDWRENQEECAPPAAHINLEMFDGQ